MRDVVSLNARWAFAKGVSEPPEAIPPEWYLVNLPHSWNGIDGSDGGGDYYRGPCCYAKVLERVDLPQAERYFLEVNGANSSATVYADGQVLAHHDGGYSTWRVDVTEALGARTLLAVVVDNAPSDRVYPQQADFTFYGGLYRGVNLVCVGQSHFELERWGTPGLHVTPRLASDDATDATVEVECQVAGAHPGQELLFKVRDAEGAVVAEVTQPVEEPVATLSLPDAHRWDGRRDPYLYTAEVALPDAAGEPLDAVSARFGCRTFRIDPERGFFLNGRSYPLHGVSRHQDRPEIGNALLPCHHEEDVDLICEMGANTVRLAHYQHDQHFYDLCDERGLVVWAEIPYISSHLPEGRENTLSQMRELITQCYNHPSIVVWGLSNEISMGGSSESLLENHRALNDLAHELDPTRKTVVAVLSNCDPHDPYLQIPDAISYNHYYGWYGGTPQMNGPWFDRFHEEFPDRAVGMSEYGCEALDWHTSDPRQGDYTEEYQARYHEELIRQLFSRPYIWATHVWNMFDFGADNRSEGGEPGQNHKGLVTFDRAYKKDAFYAYKAWLSDEPFVHLCGKRYVDRAEDVTQVTVYSNLPEVALWANGALVGTATAEDHFFRFEVPLAAVPLGGEVELRALAGSCSDTGLVRHVAEPNPAYVLREKGAVLNWFDITAPAGRLSLNDTIADIVATDEGRAVVVGLFAQVLGAMGSGATGETGANAGGETSAGAAGETAAAAGMSLDALLELAGSFTMLRLANMLGVMGQEHALTKEQLLDLNARLNQVARVG